MSLRVTIGCSRYLALHNRATQPMCWGLPFIQLDTKTDSHLMTYNLNDDHDLPDIISDVTGVYLQQPVTFHIVTKYIRIQYYCKDEHYELNEVISIHFNKVFSVVITYISGAERSHETLGNCSILRTRWEGLQCIEHSC